MIKQRRTTFGNGSEIVEEEIDTTALEVGDKFVLVKKNPLYGLDIIPLTVSKIMARDIVSVSKSGERYRFNKAWQESHCYSPNSEYVKKASLEIKKKMLFRALEKSGPGAIDQELLAALESWNYRQIAKNTQEPER